MEVLLFALFFIVSLIFFIAGKDDFGRKNLKSNYREKEDIENKIELNKGEELKKEVESEST